MPTGWRPEGFEEKYPVKKINDVFNFEKYNPQASNLLKGWSWIQLTISIALVLHCFNDITNIGVTNGLIYGLFLVYSIHCFTTLMDQKASALVYETAKFIMALSVIYITGDWFLISQYRSTLELEHVFPRPCQSQDQTALQSN